MSYVITNPRTGIDIHNHLGEPITYPNREEAESKAEQFSRASDTNFTVNPLEP